MASENICIICGDSGKDNGEGRTLGKKGQSTLVEVSRKRQDGLHENVHSIGEVYVHDKCYKSYTAEKNISAALREKTTSTGRESPLPNLRSHQKPYDYPTHCLICAEELNFEASRRNPGRYSHISNVEIVSSRDKKCVIQESLLKACDRRKDILALNVKSRIIFAGDIRAVEAKYHQKCMQAFLSSKNIAHSSAATQENVRNLNVLNDEAFSQLCAWLREPQQDQSQFTLAELRMQQMTYLPNDVPAYSTMHIKRRLLEHFGKDITIEPAGHNKNIVTLKARASSILYESYLESEQLIDKHQENIELARLLGALIKQEIQDIDHSPDIYPTPSEVSMDSLEVAIPPTLQEVISSLFSESKSPSAKEKKRLLKVSLCHVIMQATGKQSYISPLLLSVGLFIHQSTRSRVLLDVLSSLGFSASYDQVMAFERSAVVSHSINDLPPGLVGAQDGGGFCQWVADNFDYNEDTISGHDSTHVMGIIACQTPCSIAQSTTVIQRKNVSAQELAGAGDFSEFIKPYKSPAKSLMADIKIKEISPIKFNVAPYEHLDTLWLYSSMLYKSPPNWQGFMSSVIKGKCQCSSVIYNPMVPLNPQTNEAVYSTMAFVVSQSKKAGMCCATLTFDQPLYLKGYKIKQDNMHEFSNIHLRLGGFHQLMSFLGAGCKLMEGSGLEELWETVYAKKSLPKMFEGKAYTKTLRACLLTNAALHLVLVHPTKTATTSGEGDEEENTSDIEESDLNMQANPDDNDEPESMATDDMWSEIELLYKALYVEHVTTPEDVASNEALIDLHHYVCDLKVIQESRRTGRLWVMFMKFVGIIMMFIRAERTGNWKLHLKASQDMLPFFAAAGHNNYSKCCRLYLQDCLELCQCIKGPMEDGCFTVRRNENLFWSGVWSDMAIEQCLMRAGKTQGGLINITHKESARTKWLLSAHVLAQYNEALRLLTGTYTGTWSEQHRDIHPGNVKQDLKDLEKFKHFLQSHNPFMVEDAEQLKNIATGFIADDRVNVDDAITIGHKVQANLDDQRFGDIVLKKADQAKTFAVMRKPLKLEGEEVRMSSSELHQRLLSISLMNGPPDPGLFSYELATVSPALFHDDGRMRKGQKSQLAKQILQMDANIVQHDVKGQSAKVFDGCALLHRIQWPKVGTIGSVCNSFVASVQFRESSGIPICVVFDSYDVSTTKDAEQKRRKLHHAQCPNIAIDMQTPVPGNKESFLSNKHNKQNLIKLLEKKLNQAGIEVEHAGSEGDADVIIAQKALALVKSCQVLVISDDTDILVLLLHHAQLSDKLFMETKKHTISINVAKQALGQELCLCLPFAHAISGCDTTSALYSVGKVKVLKLLQSSQKLRSDVLIFGDTSASKQDICDVGEQFVQALYSGGSKAKGLDELRYLYAISLKYVPVERMPPTRNACNFHSLRVHHQVSTWRHLKTVLNKEDYGFCVEGTSVIPKITDIAPAPPTLLVYIRCSCSKSVQLCASCSCSKKGISCSVHCKCQSLCLNAPPPMQEADES